MSNYFFNHAREAESINNWFNQCGFKEITLGISGNLIVDRQSILLVNGDLMFIHASDTTWWVNIASTNPNVDFVFMSRDAAGIKKDDGWSNNIHICKYPADKLDQFDRAKRFFEELASGKRLWDLLIPESNLHLFLPLDIDMQALELLNEEERKKYLGEMYKDNVDYAGKLQILKSKIEELTDNEKIDKNRLGGIINDAEVFFKNLTQKEKETNPDKLLKDSWANNKFNSFHEWYCALAECLRGKIDSKR